MSIINKIIKVNALLVVYITKCLKICSTSRMIGTKRLTMISKCTSHTQNTACRPHVSLETNWCGPQEELRIVKKKKKIVFSDWSHNEEFRFVDVWLYSTNILIFSTLLSRRKEQCFLAIHPSLSFTSRLYLIIYFKNLCLQPAANFLW